jgi:hypothetical protein
LNHEAQIYRLAGKARKIALQIVESLLWNMDQLLFPEDSTRTEKTFMVKALIAQLTRRGKKCLMTKVVGISSVSYPAGEKV